jgi:esterase
MPASELPLSLSSLSSLSSSTTSSLSSLSSTSSSLSDSTPIIFIHGLLGSSTNFRATQTRASRSGRDTFAVDLRDHGQSPHSTGSSTLLDYAKDVALTIESRIPLGKKVDLVGHSLGGKTGMVLALTRPELIRRLVVVDIAPVAYVGEGANAISAWRDVSAVVLAAHNLDASKFRSRQAVDAKLAESGVGDPGVRSFVCQNLIVSSDGSYKWRMNSAALVASLPNFASFPADHFFPQPSSTSRPEVHFIAGEKSGYVKPHHHSKILQLFPQAHLHPPIQGAGHWVHADKPIEFWELLAKCLSLR